MHVIVKGDVSALARNLMLKYCTLYNHLHGRLVSLMLTGVCYIYFGYCVSMVTPINYPR